MILPLISFRHSLLPPLWLLLLQTHWPPYCVSRTYQAHACPRALALVVPSVQDRPPWAASSFTPDPTQVSAPRSVSWGGFLATGRGISLQTVFCLASSLLCTVWISCQYLKIRRLHINMWFLASLGKILRAGYPRSTFSGKKRLQFGQGEYSIRYRLLCRGAPELEVCSQTSLASLFSHCCCCLVAQWHPTLCDPMDCSPPGSSFSQARILEWVAIPFSRGSSWPRDQTHVSCIGRQILYHWATWEDLPTIRHQDLHEATPTQLQRGCHPCGFKHKVLWNCAAWPPCL